MLDYKVQKKAKVYVFEVYEEVLGDIISMLLDFVLVDGFCVQVFDGKIIQGIVQCCQ